MKKLLFLSLLFILLSIGIVAQQDGSLEFNETKHHHVNHGIFWKPGVNHGVFFWEAWVKPYANAQYVISDGYGGQHALLFGFSGGTERLAIAGNLFDLNTNTPISFATNETVPVNQWCHIAVGWDGQRIVSFIDGIPSSIVPFSGQRKTLPGSGAGVLFIGGSDHSNFNGKIARIRGFEGMLPVDSLLSSFTPERYFRSTYLRSDGEMVTASFLADYSTPSKTYPDLSLGYRGANHVGLLSRDVDFGFFGFKSDFSTNLPTWTPEPVTKPIYQTSAPITIPAGAIVYDSFNRANSTPVFGPTGLGMADKSFDNDKTSRRWQGLLLNQWGILGEKALNLGQSPNPVWLETGTPNMDIRAERLTGYNTGNIGLIYRYQNDSNYGYVYIGDGNVYLIEYVAGAISIVRTGVQPSLWFALRVVTNESQIKVYCGSQQVISTTSTNLPTATKAGMKGSTELGERFDNFTVYPGTN
jgi:Concanavalin A-like lectin/glucanases superfamily